MLFSSLGFPSFLLFLRDLTHIYLQNVCVSAPPPKKTSKKQQKVAESGKMAKNVKNWLKGAKTGKKSKIKLAVGLFGFEPLCICKYHGERKWVSAMPGDKESESLQWGWQEWEILSLRSGDDKGEESESLQWWWQGRVSLSSGDNRREGVSLCTKYHERDGESLQWTWLEWGY